MSHPNAKLLVKIESQIRLSQFQEATQLLYTLNRKKLGHKELIQFSRFACRLSLPGLGLQKLRSTVRPSNRKSAIASPQHFIEYAICLIRIGACVEARGILKTIDTKQYPQALPVWGALHFRQWDLEPAATVFREHVAVLQADSYQLTVSKMNLSMALIYQDQFNEAASLLNEIITSGESWEYPLLRGNCYRLLGILELNRGNYEVALTCLQKASVTFGSAQSTDAFLVRKTIAITRYFMQKASKEVRQNLDDIRTESIKRQSWEDVRSIDYYLALFHKDESLIHKLYFGTSHPYFRKRLRTHFPDVSIPSTFVWRLGGGSQKTVSRFDITEGILKPGKALFNLMAALTSDLYRPFTAVELFERVFPGDFYLPQYSERNVFSLVRRIRAIFKKESLPFVINLTEGAYQLSTQSPIDLVLRDTTDSSVTQFKHRIQQLESHFSGKLFSVRDAMAACEISRTSATALIRDAVDLGFIRREGSGNQVQYLIASSNSNVEKKAA